MTKERIEELMEKGYITRVASAEVLAAMTENELIEKGYITQVGIFDGSDDTVEDLEQEDVVDTPTPTSVVDEDEPTDNPEENDDTDATDPEGNDDDEPTKPVVDEGEEE